MWLTLFAGVRNGYLRTLTSAKKRHVFRSPNSYYCYYYLLTYLLIYLLTYLLIAAEFSLGGGIPYASTDKTNKIKYT
jgi:hypothetical protein